MCKLSAQDVTQVQLKDLEEGLNERIVNKIARDTFGYFYLFSNNSIQRYDGTSFESVKVPEGAEKILSDITDVITDNSGGLIAYTEQKIDALHIKPAQLTSKYIKYDSTNDRQLQLNYLAQQLLDDDFAKCIIRNNDTIIISNGSFLKLISGEPQIIGDSTIQKGLNCNVLKVDKNGNVIAVLGYVNNESINIKVLRKDGRIQDYSGILEYNDKVKDIYCDDIDHRCMVASFNGLYIISFRRKGIEVFYRDESASSSGFGYLVMGVSACGPDVIFGDENYGLRKIDKKGNVELLFPDEEVDFFSNERMYYDKLNKRYCTTANFTDDESIVYIFDTTFTDLKKQVIPFSVSNFRFVGKEELLLVGEDKRIKDRNISGKVMLWNTESNSGKTLIQSIPSVISVEKYQDEYWLATTNGLFIIDSDFKSIQKITSIVGDKYLLCAKACYDKMYVGSYGNGLFIIDPDTKEVLGHYDKANFLSDDIVAAIEEDDVGNIWLSTFNGINVIDQNDCIISKVMFSDGLSHREMNTNAISKDRDGNLYFGTLNSLTKVNPEEVLAWSSSQGLYINHATAYYKNDIKVVDLTANPIRIKIGFDSLILNVDFPDYANSIFDNPINYLNVNEVPVNVFSSDKRGLLIKPEELNKAPVLKFKNRNNLFNESLEFDPQYDLTKLIILSLLAFCVIGFLLIIFYRNKFTRVLFEQDEKIEINKRIAELELSALQSQMNPHFIFNALGAVQYFIQTQKTEEADNFLADFALLMRKILESSKAKFITLKEEKEILDLYINIEQLRFDGLFDFAWHIEDNVDMENVIPPMILQPFVENAINHGLFTLKDKKGKLNIYVREHKNKIEFVIKDNGIGRKEAALLRNKSHKPRGMQIVNDRITTLNTLEDIIINIETEDLYIEDNPAGTAATITITYNHSMHEAT